METTVSFDVNDTFFWTTVKITNNSDKTISNVRYVRSFDPDQDQATQKTYKTYNKVICNPYTDYDPTGKYSQYETAMVVARGEKTLEPFFFMAFDSRARASMLEALAPKSAYDSVLWSNNNSLPTTVSEDLYTMSYSNTNGYSNIDAGIAITFACGDLAPGKSTTLFYVNNTIQNMRLTTLKPCKNSETRG